VLFYSRTDCASIFSCFLVAFHAPFALFSLWPQGFFFSSATNYFPNIHTHTHTHTKSHRCCFGFCFTLFCYRSRTYTITPLHRCIYVCTCICTYLGRQQKQAPIEATTKIIIIITQLLLLAAETT